MSCSCSCSDSRPSLAMVGLNFGRHIVAQLVEGEGASHVRLAGLCDLDRAKAEALAAKYAGKTTLKLYDSLDDVLADPAVQTVGLFTGPVHRADLLRKIIRAGKDVMTTKPFELDADAATAILEEAESLGRVIHLNSPNPGISPDLAQIESWRETLQLGRPVAARIETFVRYDEKPDGSWYDDPDLCPAPPIFRLGIYLINDLVRLMGRVKRVSLFSTRLFTRRPTSDNAQLALEFENGALGNVFSSFCVRDGDHYRNSLELNFENGTVYRNVGPVRTPGAQCELTVVQARQREDGELERTITATAQTSSRSGGYDWEGFVKAIRHEPGAPRYDIEHVVEPLRVIRAMAEAERSGQVVTLPR
ncbi:MAG: Gfo/Idh/MocA family protein [Kiritimatiellia bacterium]|jgi:predicted dehydrogenase